MTKPHHIFTVDGKPFYPIGGQTRNSSGYNFTEWKAALNALDLIHGNTLEIPVYWEQVEPEEGVFDFNHLFDLMADALLYDARLILLWFGTWKNGNMEYAPDWVKTDPERFKRVVSPGGNDLWVLSSHCEATFEADRRAFTALCAFLKEADKEQRVIAIQIENEPGILGADRDYGRAGLRPLVGSFWSGRWRVDDDVAHYAPHRPPRRSGQGCLRSAHVPQRLAGRDRLAHSRR